MVDRNTSKQELLPLRQAEWGAAEGTDLFLVFFLSEIVLMWQQEFFCWLVCLFESALLFLSPGCCLSSGGAKNWPNALDIWEPPKALFYAYEMTQPTHLPCPCS